MGCANLGQVDHLMVTISVVFLAVSIKLTQQSNSHLFDQQSEASPLPFDSSPDELPVFVDATTSGEEDDERRVLSIGIPEGKRIPSGIVQPTISLAEEDPSGSLNEFNWSRNADEVVNREKMKFSSKSKRSGCSGPPIRARGLIGTTIKRSHFATSRAEVAKRMEEENKMKRNAEEGSSTRDHHSFSCDTSYEWRDLGTNHYPQFVKTAVCRSSTCVNGIYECRPKDYSLRVLKRVSISDSVCEETQDDSLPESLNLDWRLVTVKITHCCDCTSRLATFQI